MFLAAFTSALSAYPQDWQAKAAWLLRAFGSTVPHALQRKVTAAEENEPWWTLVTAAARHEDPAGADLPVNGLVWQYTLGDFLVWVNNITWASEWQKYDVTAPGGGPAPVPARPIARV